MSLLGWGLAGAGLGYLLNAGSGLFTGLYGASSSLDAARENNREAARQFDENMAWQREQFAKMVEMQNTAHQREVADLRAAGLNPILSAGGSGLSSPGGVSSVGPTAHYQAPDISGSLKLIADGISSANEQALKTADLHSQIGLREAQGAEALSKAAQNKELTPVMKKDFLARAEASAAGARYHNTMSDVSQSLLPEQRAQLQSEVTKNLESARGQRKANDWYDRKMKDQLTTNAARRDFLRDQTDIQIYDQIRKTADMALDFVPGRAPTRQFRRFFKGVNPEQSFNPGYPTPAKPFSKPLF